MITRMNVTIGGEKVEMEMENSVTELREMYKLMKEILKDAPEMMEDMEKAYHKFKEIDARNEGVSPAKASIAKKVGLSIVDLENLFKQA